MIFLEEWKTSLKSGFLGIYAFTEFLVLAGVSGAFPLLLDDVLLQLIHSDDITKQYGPPTK